jgi:hypothetical protein
MCLRYYVPCHCFVLRVVYLFGVSIY